MSIAQEGTTPCIPISAFRGEVYSCSTLGTASLGLFLHLLIVGTQMHAAVARDGRGQVLFSYPLLRYVLHLGMNFRHLCRAQTALVHGTFQSHLSAVVMGLSGQTLLLL